MPLAFNFLHAAPTTWLDNVDNVKQQQFGDAADATRPDIYRYEGVAWRTSGGPAGEPVIDLMDPYKAGGSFDTDGIDDWRWGRIDFQNFGDTPAVDVNVYDATVGRVVQRHFVASHVALEAFGNGGIGLSFLVVYSGDQKTDLGTLLQCNIYDPTNLNTNYHVWCSSASGFNESPLMAFADILNHWVEFDTNWTCSTTSSSANGSASIRMRRSTDGETWTDMGIVASFTGANFGTSPQVYRVGGITYGNRIVIGQPGIPGKFYYAWLNPAEDEEPEPPEEAELPAACAPEYTEATENPTGDITSGSGETYFDYWVVGYDGLGHFPPARSLLLTENWARDATITLAEGAGAFNEDSYPASRLVDGTLATAFRMVSRAGMIILDLGEPLTPDVFAVLCHNLYAPMVVAALGSNNADMSSPVVTAGFNARHPVAWVDLRGYTFVPARYWALDIPFRYGVRGASIGEIALGPVDEYRGIVDPGFTISPRRWTVSSVTENGTPIHYLTGTSQRTCNMTLRMTVEDEIVFHAAVREIGHSDKRMLVVPSSLTHEAVWVESVPRLQRPWRNHRETTVSFDLLEETLGAV